MRDKEIVGLYQAYLDVYSNSNEEVEQLDEDVQGAVDTVTKGIQNKLKGLGFPVNTTVRGTTTKAQQERKINPVKEEVEELDEVSDELVDKAVNARIAATGAANKREMEDRTPENMRDSARAGEKEASMKSAVARRRQRKLNKEEVEKLDEDGLPYGPVGKGFEKLPAGKKRAAMMKRASALRTKAMKDDGDGGRGSARGKMGEINAALTNPRLREETDLFDAILEHLVAEGYADTNESALAIMANMSDEWRQSIVEGGFNSSGRYDVGGGRTVGPVAGAVRSLFSGNLPKGQTYVPPSPQKGTNRPPAVPSSKGDSGKLTDFGAGGGKAKLKTGMSVGQVERQGRMNKGDYSG